MDINQAYTDYDNEHSDSPFPNDKKIAIDRLGPASALAFFLGGMPDEDGRPSGFSTNQSNPFALGGSRTDLPFELDVTRYKVENNVPLYCPKYIKDPTDSTKGVPYVYFRARSGCYGAKDNTQLLMIPCVEFPGDTSTKRKIAVPYARGEKASGEIDWYKPKSFQIIAAGMDGEFSEERNPGTGLYRYFKGDDSNLNKFEDDNLSSFTQGRLEDGVQ